ncbi:MAG: EamA family transporter [Candidatus Omnitrophica bacterium]|nr:EamA family transporter [Candidatus Omnitrophota bacterium]
MRASLFLILICITISNAFDAIRDTFLKSAINSVGELGESKIKNVIRFVIRLLKKPQVWISFACSIVSLFFYLFVLSKAELNFAFSLDSMHYIFIAFSAKFFLKEKVGPKRWLGTAFVVVGIILVTLS